VDEEEAYIAKMIAKGHSQKRAESYWAAKSGNYTPVEDDDESVGGTLGGQILRARDPNYDAFNIDDVVPNRKRRAQLRTVRLIDEENDRIIDIFKSSGVPVVRKVGDHRRFARKGGCILVKLGVKSDTALLIDLHYLPCIEFFTYLQRFDKIIIEAQENYQKQSYRNRCRIMGPNRVLELSVPVLKPSGKTKIKEVRIDNHQNWIQRHWRGLRASYGRAPFFEFFSDEFHQPLTKPHIFLFDLNLLLLHTTLQVLGIDKEIELSASYQTEASSGTFDARARIHPQCEYDHNGYWLIWLKLTQIMARLWVLAFMFLIRYIASTPLVWLISQPIA